MENINKIYYINLAKRTDRNDHMVKMLTRYQQKVERFDAIHDTYGAIGCSASHVALLKIAMRDKLNNVMICEDDLLIPDMNLLEQKLKIFFDDNIQWDVLVICGIIISKTPCDSNYARVRNNQTTTCYIVNNNYFCTLLANYETSLQLLTQTRNYRVYALDQYMKQLQKTDKWYCLTPMMGYQMPSYSDIENCDVNYLRKFKKFQ